MQEAERLIHSFDLSRSPPDNAIPLYGLLAKLTGITDPFAALKKNSNHTALALVPRLRAIIEAAADPLETAARLAIAGNIIDYGASQDFDVERAIADCLSRTPAVNHFARFLEMSAKAERILYLADNCGELVFDRLFIEQLGKPVTLVVKARPIINDALVADAEACGLMDLCRVIDNGTGCPGTPLATCNPEFQRIFGEADLIISKGQGNFETLSDTVAPLFFMLLLKCSVVATEAAEMVGLKSGMLGLGDLLMLAAESLPVNGSLEKSAHK